MKGNRPRDVFGGKEKQEVPKEKQTAKLLWRPPEEGWIKINVDGSYVERTGQASAGVIIRDHNAHVLHGSTYFIASLQKKQSSLHAGKAYCWPIIGVMVQLLWNLIALVILMLL